MRKFILDANCYIDATRNLEHFEKLTRFAEWATPALFLSSVVTAELRAGARSPKDRKVLEAEVFGPLIRRGRVITPSVAAWDALGLTLSSLREDEGLQLSQVPRSFMCDILLAYSCREAGAVLITGNERDMVRIRKVFSFEFLSPYPERPAAG